MKVLLLLPLFLSLLDDFTSPFVQLREIPQFKELQKIHLERILEFPGLEGRSSISSESSESKENEDGSRTSHDDTNFRWTHRQGISNSEVESISEESPVPRPDSIPGTESNSAEGVDPDEEMLEKELNLGTESNPVEGTLAVGSSLASDPDPNPETGSSLASDPDPKPETELNVSVLTDEELKPEKFALKPEVNLNAETQLTTELSPPTIEESAITLNEEVQRQDEPHSPPTQDEYLVLNIQEFLSSVSVKLKSFGPLGYKSDGIRYTFNGFDHMDVDGPIRFTKQTSPQREIIRLGFKLGPVDVVAEDGKMVATFSTRGKFEIRNRILGSRRIAFINNFRQYDVTSEDFVLPHHVDDVEAFLKLLTDSSSGFNDTLIKFQVKKLLEETLTAAVFQSAFTNVPPHVVDQ